MQLKFPRNKSLEIRLFKFVCLCVILSLFSNSPLTYGQSYPSGFSQIQLASNINAPTAMAFTPDNRIFICRKNGQILIFKNGAINAIPFVNINTTPSGERGLLGIALDPNFETNNYVYVYYTLASGARNRVSRFTANGDVAVAGSEMVILDLDPLSTATNHNGGTIKFGLDGKLYISVGDNYNSANAQNLNTYHGKLLRINADGSIPTNNPYTNGTAQKKRIWATGLRNPFSFDVQKGTGRIFINDVGLSNYEEINEATQSNRNFGWPNVEGYVGGQTGYTNPVYAYNHGNNDSSGCAITGGIFYNPTTGNYPPSLQGMYFFIDYCSSWIGYINFNGTTPVRHTFATGIAENPVALTLGNDGCIYYLSRVTNSLYKIAYVPVASPPVITMQPQATTLSVNQILRLQVSVSGTMPFTFQWYKNNLPISGASSSELLINSVAMSDSGSYKCTITNSFGNATTNSVKVAINNNTPPVATIITPMLGSNYAGNETLFFNGSATDAQDGNLPATAFNWYLEFHHEAHTHPGPYISPFQKSGSFKMPNTGEVSDNVYYRLYLIVTDSYGAVDSEYVDILPRKSYINLITNPPGLKVNIDGVPIQTPAQVLSVEGIIRNLSPNTPQLSNSVSYAFDSWSQGGNATQSFTTPVDDTTFIANYSITYRYADNPVNVVNGLYYKYYTGSWTSIPAYNSLTPNKEGVISIFDYAPRTVSDYFGFRFNGYIDVPSDSVYTFYTSSDDGSRLYIGNVLVVDNDGVHPAQERSGSIGLKAGKHAITVEYFERNGGQVFNVSWQGPGIAKQTIPASNLYRFAGPVTSVSTADAYVRSGSFKNNNLGQTDASRLYTKYADPVSDQCRETFLLFDISKFTNEFGSATLDIFGKLKGVDLSSAAEVSCWSVENTFWLETTLSFANKPLAAVAALSVQYVNDVNGKYYSFDISNYVRQLLNEGYTNASFLLKGNFAQNNYVIWNSKETAGANKPRITCNYASPRQMSLYAQSSNGLDIYPNPASDNWVTIGCSIYPALVSVYDLQGQLIEQHQMDNDLMQLPIEKLGNGIYLIQAVGNNCTATQKLQVIKN